jgi:hypothetical protein
MAPARHRHGTGAVTFDRSALIAKTNAFLFLFFSILRNILSNADLQKKILLGE